MVQMLGWFSAEAACAFALEAGQSLWVFGYFVGQELQGDKAVQLYVLGLVDHAHAAAAQLLDDAVVRDGLADHLLRKAHAFEQVDVTRIRVKGHKLLLHL